MACYKGETIIAYTADSDKLVLHTKNSTISIYAEGDCCSLSWFEYCDNIYSQIVGKTILDINETENISLTHDKKIHNMINNLDDTQVADNNCYRQYYKITIIFDDNTQYKFLMTNESNGYYSGYISIRKKTSNNEKIISSCSSLNKAREPKYHYKKMTINILFVMLFIFIFIFILMVSYFY